MLRDGLKLAVHVESREQNFSVFNFSTVSLQDFRPIAVNVYALAKPSPPCSRQPRVHYLNARVGEIRFVARYHGKTMLNRRRRDHRIAFGPGIGYV